MTHYEECRTKVIRDITHIIDKMNLSDEERAIIMSEVETYPFSTTEYYADLIDYDKTYGPLYRLQAPIVDELAGTGDVDTSGEKDYTVVPGLQHKYAKTALLLITNKCAVYCRHCFRKRLIGKENDEVLIDLEPVVRYIDEHREIDNVLISGGDSFFISNKRIRELLERFSAIEHLEFIRFGTRIPVVMPSRIYLDHHLLDLFEEYSKKVRIQVVTQFNHPKEVTPEAAKAIEALRSRDIQVRNQAVLLKGVNDDPAVIVELMNKLMSIGIIPYYMYQCRPTKGVKRQFQLSLSRAIDIVEEAKRELNGLAKNFKFIMSTYAGKIEVVGKTDDNSKICFKFHQAYRRNDMGNIFFADNEEDFAWLSGETLERVSVEE